MFASGIRYTATAVWGGSVTITNILINKYLSK